MMASAQNVADPPQTLEDQLREAYELVDELHHMEDRLRVAIENALTTIKGEDSNEPRPAE